MNQHSSRVFSFFPNLGNIINQKYFLSFTQEIYRPGIAISHVSNLCTAVGGDKNKEFRGNASFLREKGGGIRIYCYCIFHIDQKAKNYKYSR